METKALGDFISIYEKFAQAENKSHRYIEAITDAIYKFNNFIGGNSNPQDITSDDLRKYILHLQERSKWSDHPTIKQNHDKLSSNTIAHHVRHIKSFWAWLCGEGFIDHNPLARVKTPKETGKVVTPLSPDEVTQLLKVIPRNTHKCYRDSCIIACLYGTLLRISELLDLELSNVNSHQWTNHSSG
ncbi:tyrosine-type recombinase/integrase [Chloroflexota bacterium]